MKGRLFQRAGGACTATAVLFFAIPQTAQAQSPGSAEGDAYAAFGQIFLVSAGPINAGLIAPARATVPPGTTQSSGSGVVNYSSCVAAAGSCSSFQQPVIDAVNVPGDNAKATLGQTASTDCNVPGVNAPPGFNSGPLTGANACAHVAQAALLNSATTGAPKDLVAAEGVDAQSTTQSCTANPTGDVSIAHLSVGGVDVVGGTGLPPKGTIKPNTKLNLAAATVILNEQVYDSHGHGLTVNAIHVFTNSTLLPALLGTSADVIVAHAHSQAMCSDGSTTDTAGLNTPAPSGQAPLTTAVHSAPTVTVTDSTKHANPGEDVAYALSVDNHGCAITSVTDTLPPGFNLISASGDLGAPAASYLAKGQQQLFWAPSGKAYPVATNPLAETLNVHIDSGAPAGQAIDTARGTSDCGSFSGSDLLGLSNSTPANNGDNPGIIVPRTDPGSKPNNGGGNLGAGTAYNRGQLVAAAAGASNLPGTSTAGHDIRAALRHDIRPALGVIVIGLLLALASASPWLRPRPSG